MIISHRHRFIFIKTQKTAGTSIEIALSQHCGVEDVITPLMPKDEQIRRECGGRGPQNFVFPSVPFARYCQLLQRIPFEWATKAITNQFGDDASFHAFNHLPAACVRRLVDPDIWRDYFVFCVERDPVHKVRSYHRWLSHHQTVPDINAFIASGSHANVADFGLYTEQGQMLVDQVFPYERLQDWWPDVCKRIGTELIELPTAKQSTKSESSGMPLNEHAKLQIAVEFAREIKLFGYRDPTAPRQ